MLRKVVIDALVICLGNVHATACTEQRTHSRLDTIPNSGMSRRLVMRQLVGGLILRIRRVDPSSHRLEIVDRGVGSLLRTIPGSALVGIAEILIRQRTLYEHGYGVSPDHAVSRFDILP